MSRNKIRYLVGTEKMHKMPLPVYDEMVLAFLDGVSQALRENVRARKYADIQTFAFWCRRANLKRLREESGFTQYRIGRGTVFHVAPSNVPINFAFSFVFGLLAGNGNIVRVSSKEFEQTGIVCEVLREVLEKSDYEILREQNQIVSYEHDQEITDLFSAACDARVIWGGDAAIREIRKSPVDTRCVEIAFADRSSIAVIREREIEKLTSEERKRLAENFYNDTYLMDQNACSSPHLIFWLNEEENSGKKGRELFYQAVYEESKKYDLAEKKVMDKYTLLCEQLAADDDIVQTKRYGNRLYVAQMERIPERAQEVRGKFGLFYEADIRNLDELAGCMTKRMQTCIYFGIEKEEVLDVIRRNHVQGIDRIVPMGKALDIGVHWDGYDVIGTLSREITLI